MILRTKRFEEYSKSEAETSQRGDGGAIQGKMQLKRQGPAGGATYARSGARLFAGMALRLLERVAGIEPASQAWKASALPLSYTRPAEERPAIIAGDSSTRIASGG